MGDGEEDPWELMVTSELRLPSLSSHVTPTISHISTSSFLAASSLCREHCFCWPGKWLGGGGIWKSTQNQEGSEPNVGLPTREYPRFELGTSDSVSRALTGKNLDKKHCPFSKSYLT